MKRGKNAGKKKARTIRVESGRVYVVPYAVARSYFRAEIEHEGFHRKASPFVLFPKREAGEATREWVENVFAALDDVRASHPPETLGLRGLIPDGRAVDVGLIDIPITFRGPLQLVMANLGARLMAFLEENMAHVDGLFAGTFHDQMTLVNVLHTLRPDGVPEIHYHNVVFGVRREFRDGRVIVGPLDVRPMLDALTRRLRLGLVQ